MHTLTIDGPARLHNNVDLPISTIELLPATRSQSSGHAPKGQPVLEDDEAPPVILSRSRTVLVIATLTGVTLANSMSTGLLTVGLPRIAADLRLSEDLLLW